MARSAGRHEIGRRRNILQGTDLDRPMCVARGDLDRKRRNSCSRRLDGGGIDVMIGMLPSI